ncbi:MAG: hypothetical protein OEW75_18615 [Cyclobacteriaceae bacterium]|nr:hypothetical protein [Cyclobacteriaceae bacterium]
MVDIAKLDKEFQEIVIMKNTLYDLGYDNPKYDEMEEQLHDLEDDFVDEFGDYLEDALKEIHDKYCPDNDILLPIAYMANRYFIDEKNVYSVEAKEGVFVDADDFPGNNPRLVMLPNPTRFVLYSGTGVAEIVWLAK